ncbi:MAG TPA: hypothetical protein VNZ44_05585 [Pyrinomonadaceae bacterium]|nr:hypothetical protein [Pyrinomonadaceae bacterium]
MTFANHVRERGGARFNFVVTVLLIGLAAYSAYQYVPIAYKAYLFKDYMQETVNKAAYPPGQTSDWVAQQLRAAAKEYDVPPDMQVSVQNENGRLAARVTYTRPVQLPGYVYQYNFDHTALSSSFVSGQ